MDKNELGTLHSVPLLSRQDVLEAIGRADMGDNLAPGVARALKENIMRIRPVAFAKTSIEVNYGEK